MRAPANPGIVIVTDVAQVRSVTIGEVYRL